MSDWLVIPEPVSQSSAVLVAFHHAGGSAQNYAPLLKYTPSNVELQLVELPGRGFRKPSADPLSFHSVCRAIQKAILENIRGRDLYIFGHSMGGLLGFETARLLAGQCALKKIGLSATSPGPFPAVSREELEMVVMQNGSIPDSVKTNPTALNALLQRLGGDFGLLEGIIAGSLQSPGVEVFVVGGESDPFVPPAKLMTWKDHVPNATFRLFPGGHFYFDEVPNVADILGLQGDL